MTTAHTFTATAPDGTVHTRQTESKLYTYAVLVNSDTHRLVSAGDEPTWGAWSWHTREDLAYRERDRAIRVYGTVIVVPVDNPIDAFPEPPAARYCTECRRSMTPKKDGTSRAHDFIPGRRRCEGSGTALVAETDLEPYEKYSARKFGA